MPDVLPATLIALFVACSSCCIFGAAGAWTPYYLSTEKHWSTQEYSAFYVWWGIVGFLGLWLAGRPDRPPRRLHHDADPRRHFYNLVGSRRQPHTIVDVRSTSGLRLLGIWGPSTTLTAEVFATRIRGAANGVVWAIAYVVGFVLWPFVTVALQQSTGSFALAFLCIPA